MERALIHCLALYTDVAALLRAPHRRSGPPCRPGIPRSPALPASASTRLHHDNHNHRRRGNELQKPSASLGILPGDSFAGWQHASCPIESALPQPIAETPEYATRSWTMGKDDWDYVEYIGWGAKLLWSNADKLIGSVNRLLRLGLKTSSSDFVVRHEGVFSVCAT